MDFLKMRDDIMTESNYAGAKKKKSASSKAGT